MKDPRLHILLKETVAINAESGTQPFLADRIIRDVRALNRPEEQFFQMLWVAFKPILFAYVFLVLGFFSPIISWPVVATKYL